MSRKDDLVYEIALVEAYLKRSSVPEFAEMFKKTLDKLKKELKELEKKHETFTNTFIPYLVRSQTAGDKRSPEKRNQSR